MFSALQLLSSKMVKLTRRPSTLSKLAWEQRKEKKRKRNKQKKNHNFIKEQQQKTKQNKPMEEIKTEYPNVKVKKNRLVFFLSSFLLFSCFFFFKWMAFLPYTLLQAHYTPTWLMHDTDKNGFYYHGAHHGCTARLQWHHTLPTMGRGRGGGYASITHTF